MSRRVPSAAIAAAVAAVLFVSGTGSPASTPAGFQGPPLQVFAHPDVPVTLTFRSLQPGEAIVARLTDGAAVRAVELTFGDQVRLLGPAGEGRPGTPMALFGIDMATTPRDLILKVRTERMDGTKETRDLSLTVAMKRFPSTRLEVAPDMASPPREVQETIRREAALVAEVLSRITPAWLAEGNFQSPLPTFEPYPNFGQRRMFNKTVSSIHAGVDISAPRGTRAEAPNRGRIVLASRLYLSGWTVIIDHGRGVFTYCCHFDKVLVKRGDMVRKGQAIALVGSTGRSTGPHLHWSVRIFSARVDPLSLLALTLED
jgi:murein DD-endopeptidase MepM/ murein hydrolase activator NlpD